MIAHAQALHYQHATDTEKQELREQQFYDLKTYNEGFWNN